jgi:hypothetical protein
MKKPETPTKKPKPTVEFNTTLAFHSVTLQDGTESRHEFGVGKDPNYLTITRQEDSDELSFSGHGYTTIPAAQIAEVVAKLLALRA